MTFPFPIVSPAAAGVSFSYTDTAQDATDQTTYTFSARSLGAADSARYIVVGVGARNEAVAISSVTIGGVTASSIVSLESSPTRAIAALYGAAVPTGTTGDVVVTFASAGALNCCIALYRLLGYSTTAYATGTDNTIASNLLSTTIDIPSSGAAIGVRAEHTGSGSGPSTAWVGLATADVAVNNLVESGATYVSVASSSGMSSETGRTVSCHTTGSGPRGALVVASFQPA